jgi:hypothetical protein
VIFIIARAGENNINKKIVFFFKKSSISITSTSISSPKPWPPLSSPIVMMTFKKTWHIIIIVLDLRPYTSTTTTLLSKKPPISLKFLELLKVYLDINFNTGRIN